MRSEGSGCKSCWLSMKDDAWHLDLETMDTPIKNELKTVCLAQVADILQAAYRNEPFPKALWEQLLGRTLALASADEQLKHDRLLHADVSRIIIFFNIPGPVTRWLPPIESLSVCNGRLLAFSYTCYLVQHAPAAVDTMLIYWHHQEPNQPEHVAVYVVVKDDHYKVNVHVFKAVDAGLINILQQKSDAIGTACADENPRSESMVFGSFVSMNMGLTTQLLAKDGSLSGAINSLRVAGGIRNKLVGPSKAHKPSAKSCLSA